MMMIQEERINMTTVIAVVINGNFNILRVKATDLSYLSVNESLKRFRKPTADRLVCKNHSLSQAKLTLV